MVVNKQIIQKKIIIIKKINESEFSRKETNDTNTTKINHGLPDLCNRCQMLAIIILFVFITAQLDESQI